MYPLNAVLGAGFFILPGNVRAGMDGEKTMAYFATGFRYVAHLLLVVSGGVAAVAVFLAVVMLVGCLAGLIFDRVTHAMARHWEKRGHQPRGKLEQVILEAYRRLE